MNADGNCLRKLTNEKVALVFVLAVLVPSLLLAWLAVRSLRDQQFLLERQQSLLDQHATDTLAQNISGYLAQQQQEFSAQVESLAAAGDAQTLATKFDDQLRQRWPLADVGFCVTAAGKILSPSPNARPAAQMFRLDNSGFLGNREPVEVYLTANNANVGYNSSTANNGWYNNTLNSSRGQAGQSSPAFNVYANNSATLPLQSQRQETKPEEQLDASKPSAPSQTFAINGTGGGGGGFGGGNATNLKSASPTLSGTTEGLALAGLTALAPQQKQESPPAVGIERSCGGSQLGSPAVLCIGWRCFQKFQFREGGPVVERTQRIFHSFGCQSAAATTGAVKARQTTQ